MRTIGTILLLLMATCAFGQTNSRVIEILADHDSRFKIAGHANPTLTLLASETVTLRITAVKAKTMNRDGSIHGFVLVDKTGERVDGWALSLQPGTHDFELVAPKAAGDYQVVCNVICSHDHEMMHMKIKVLPSSAKLESKQ
jgi:heme/copper-type cytochrome/quinol oxidase subunit 2